MKKVLTVLLLVIGILTAALYSSLQRCECAEAEEDLANYFRDFERRET